MSTFLQLSVSGLSVGFLYALIALGFVVILKSTRVMNLFQAGFVLLAGFLAYQIHVAWHVPFALTVVLCMAATAALGVLIEWALISRMRAGFDGAVLVTAGLITILAPIVSAVWGDQTRQIDDPWGLGTVQVGDVVIAQANLWVVGLSIIALAAFFAVFQLTSFGIAMRAVASDVIAARAQGIRPRVVVRMSWAAGGLLGGLAGVMASTAVGGGAQPSLTQFALGALPGMIIGGIGSPAGAVVGSLLVGLIQTYTTGYAPAALGGSFPAAMPYLVLLLVLVVRPMGLFSSAQVRSA